MQATIIDRALPRIHADDQKMVAAITEELAQLCERYMTDDDVQNVGRHNLVTRIVMEEEEAAAAPSSPPPKAGVMMTPAPQMDLYALQMIDPCNGVTTQGIAFENFRTGSSGGRPLDIMRLIGQLNTHERLQTYNHPVVDIADHWGVASFA
jgi:hypothetical protein